MARKRIHEFAKEWEVESRQIIAALTTMNVRGKKSQSTLSEQEADDVRQALGLSPTPTLALGEEKVVAARVVTELDQQKDHVVAAREEVSENRIRPNVIRRRKRVEVLSDPEPASSRLTCLSAFTSPTAPTQPSPSSPAASSSASPSPPPWSTTPRSSSWTNPPPGLTPRRAAPSGSSCKR